MDIDRTWLVGGAGLVVGGLIGLAIAGDGRESREAALERQAAVSESVGRIEQGVTDLGARVATLEAAVAEGARQEAGQAEGLEKRLEAVGADIDGAVRDIGGAVAALGSDVTSRLSAPIEGLRSAMNAIGGRSRGSGAGDDAAAAPAAAGAGETLSPGQVIAFGDGAARLFLSGTDPEAGTARVAINGPVATVVALNEPVEAGTCTLTLTGFSETGASFTGDCGEDGGGAAEPKAAAGAATGAGVALAMGASTALADGKLSVFLSGIDAEAGTARVAVNGPRTALLTVGQPVEAGGCTLTLTGVGDGGATVDAAC
ncbi:MAG TPA: hypothetical protein VM891_13885 [Amaricoccus sp.]|nr:hypothetical protein [Amaricoccus sp.]